MAHQMYGTSSWYGETCHVFQIYGVNLKYDFKKWINKLL